MTVPVFIVVVKIKIDFFIIFLTKFLFMPRSILILILIFLAFTSFKFPGSNTAYLKCKSESGRTLFNAELQDITGLLEKAVFEVDQKKLEFNNQDDAYTIFDPNAGVFTVYITGKTNQEFPNSRFVEFWAIPSTFKTILSGHDHQKYQFRAKLEATEPRKNKDLRTPQIELICTLEYEI